MRGTEKSKKHRDSDHEEELPAGRGSEGDSDSSSSATETPHRRTEKREDRVLKDATNKVRLQMRRLTEFDDSALRLDSEIERPSTARGIDGCSRADP